MPLPIRHRSGTILVAFSWSLPLLLVVLAFQNRAACQVAAGGGVLVLDNCHPVWEGKKFYLDNLTSIDGTGKVAFRNKGFNSAQSIGSSHQIANDRERNCIWVIENVTHRIRKFDRAGNEILAIDDLNALSAAIDRETGNLWVLTSTGTIYGDQTFVFDPEGKRIAAYDARGFDIAYDDRQKAFWIAGQKLAKVDSATGKVEPANDGEDLGRWCASSIAVAPDTGRIWVAMRKHPQRGSRNELLVFDEENPIPLGTTTNVSLSRLRDGSARKTISLEDSSPFRVSVDSKKGCVWVANLNTSVQRYSPDGDLEFEIEMDALTCEADSNTGGVWVVTPSETLRLDAHGRPEIRVKHKLQTSQAWIAAQ